MGKFQKADGGTLFLDEVGDMSLRTQSKVLRVLEDQRFEPVGAQESIQVDVRVVAATNKNLEVEIERGNFREDLFYRLNVIPFHVPPLRERKEDIPGAGGVFSGGIRARLRTQAEGTDAAGAGGARGASLAGQRARTAQSDRAHRHSESAEPDRCAAHSAAPGARKPAPERPAERYGSLQDVREAAEREYILKKLEESNGNVSRAAELLGLERSNLYRKMRALGIAPQGITLRLKRQLRLMTYAVPLQLRLVVQVMVNRVKREFQTVRNAQLVENIVQMVLHRLLADEHPLGHFPVLETLRHQNHDLALALAQRAALLAQPEPRAGIRACRCLLLASRRITSAVVIRSSQNSPA